MAIHNEIIIYGLENYCQTIDRILTELNITENSEEHFDIKLILVEALTNAFKHGNRGDAKKPIKLRYYYKDGYVRFEVEDTGDGFNNIDIPGSLTDFKLLDNCGRGLFLINCVSDKVEFDKNIMIVEKNIQKFIKK